MQAGPRIWPSHAHHPSRRAPEALQLLGHLFQLHVIAKDDRLRTCVRVCVYARACVRVCMCV
eukprot:1143148-Pelagomonas_calceolata.AAC.5